MLRQRLHAKAGIVERTMPQGYDFATLQKTEWSPEFEQHMRNRLLMGALRYGLLADKKKNPNKWDLLKALRSKIKGYLKTHNKEYLVDAANYLLLEFECPSIPNTFFKALDDHHDHCKLKS